MEEQSERDRFSSRLSEALLLRAADEKQGAGTGQVVNVRAVNKRWRLFSVTDTGEELRGLNVTIASILTVSLLVAVIIFVIISRVIGRVILPIQTLSRHMAGIRDVLPMPVDMGRRKDEVGALAAGFNEMTGRNRELVELLLEEKKRQEQLKLSLLQSQIKPHFLYNTLDTIYCLVLMGKKEEAGRMTKLLSDYYRHVLSNGMDWVLLFEEIKYTSNYLQIQSIRYNDILDFEICVEEEVENIKIPKLTLQPLVENAIYHGIKPLDRKGHIRVLVKQKEDIVYLRVQDDGVGLSGERFGRFCRRGAEWGQLWITQCGGTSATVLWGALCTGTGRAGAGYDNIDLYSDCSRNNAVTRSKPDDTGREGVCIRFCWRMMRLFFWNLCRISSTGRSRTAGSVAVLRTVVWRWTVFCRSSRILPLLISVCHCLTE